MELPDHLKKLYRHWEFHTYAMAATSGESISARTLAHGTNQAILDDIFRFVRERIKIWKLKITGNQPPYTADPILARYRFCNIFREFDRQTIEFHEMLNPLCDDFPLWLLNMFYFRMVARTETVKHIGLLSFDAAENAKLYKRLMESPRPRYGTPYVFPISTIQRSATPTRETFICEYLSRALPAVASEIQTWNKLSVSDGLKRILPLFGFNLSFLWTEVLIDVAYQFPERIDLFAEFPVGPGSRPTMLLIDPEKEASKLVADLAGMRFPSGFDIGLTYEGRPLRLSAENWEGIGCEHRKYRNLAAGKGRKRLYKKS